jgi:peptide/nickel transport system substrate-binding protein
MPTLGAANDDTVELSNVGEQGVTNMNIPMIMNSSPVDGDTITIMGSQEGFVQTRNYLTIPALVVQVTYNNMLSSPVIGYDENYEQRNVLAESVETLDEGTRVRITLKDGATFQNGDPVTAEDVIFTYDVINSNLDVIPKSTRSPIDEYEAVDEKTVDLILEQPSPPVYTRLLATWGILHKGAWEEAGARENLAENYPDDIPGSGPFSIGTFQQGSLMEFEPYDDHVFHTADHKVRFRFYSSNESAYQAFQEGNLDIFQPVPQSYAQRIEENMDNATLEARDSFLPYIIYWQYNRPPIRYSEVRQALGMAIDREEIAEVAFRNRVNPTMAAELMQDPHPFRAPDDMLTFYTDDPSGDIEGAKQVLEDEGWTFDDDGRLRYPDDLDPAYLWEPGETPSPEDFDCLNSDGEYVPPSER